jgi:hypothetical protein
MAAIPAEETSMSRVLSAAVLAVLLGTTSGCWYAAAAGAGAGAAYFQGILEGLVVGSVADVTDAAEQVLPTMGIAVEEVERSPNMSVVRGRTSGGQEVEVRVRRLTRLTTELSVRIGWFGDEPLSRRIYDRIEERLESANP